MSFSQQVKREIVSHEIEVPCCVAATCYGIACFAKSFNQRGLVLNTERAYIAGWVKTMFNQAGINGKVYVRGEISRSYEFAVKDPYEVEKMMALFSHSGDETALRIRRENFNCGGCFAGFTAAAFVCGGVMVDPQKSYMLEFASARHSMMRDFCELLSENEFLPRRITRKGYSVIYFKASEQIEDLLTTMGAVNAVLELMNLKVYKDLRNRANRVTNCETANIDKIVAANRQSILAIRLLEKHGVLETLPQPLQDAARLRQENPDLSLSELVEISEEQVSKSGLSHRFRRLCLKAEEIRETEDGREKS